MPAAKTKSFNFDQLDRGTRFVKLRTPIDEHETAALALEAAKANREIDGLKDERKELNEQIKTLTEQRDDALKAVGTGFREKDVQCEVGYDWSAGKKYTRRLDTGELLSDDGEPIDDDERQMQLEGLGAAEIVEKREAEDELADANTNDDWNEGEEVEDELAAAIAEG